MRVAVFASIASLVLTAPANAQRENLVQRARLEPDTIRSGITRQLNAIASSRSDRERALNIATATRLANAYARAWSDSFFVRQVSRFQSLPKAGQLAHMIADSLRKAGNDALGTAGVETAMTLWRESFRHAASYRDSGVVAPLLVSIGAGHYRMGNLDSASAYLRRGQLIANAIGDWRTSGNAAGILASVTKDRGDLAAAAAQYRRASVIRGRSGDTRGIAADQNNLGLIAQQRGDIREATEAYEKALSLNRRGGRDALVALNLGNLGTLARNVGDYARADSLYNQSIAIHRANGDSAEVAFVLHELGKLQMSRGEYRQAEATLLNALRAHEMSGATVDAITVRIDLAAVQSAIGNPESARLLLIDAAKAAERSRASPEIRGSLAMARGDVAMEFGTFADADAEYSRAAELYRAARDSQGLARALEGRAVLLHLRSDDARALSLLDAVARLHAMRRDVRAAALTGLLRSEVQTSRGDRAAARRTLIASRDTLRRVGDVVGYSAALAGLGFLGLDAGSTTSAEANFRAGMKALGTRDASDVRWRLHYGLGETLQRKGLLGMAGDEFRSAIAVGEKTAATVKLEERRSGFLADKWGAYTRLALVEQARGNAAVAFSVSERMRARQLLDLLARGRVARRAPASFEEQDLKRRIALLTTRLESGSRTDYVGRDLPLTAQFMDAARTELDRAQKQYAALLVRLRDSDPSYAALVSGRTRSWRDVASGLSRDEVLIEYMLADSASTAFVVTRDTVAAIDLRTTREDIANLVEFSQKTMSGAVNPRMRNLWRAPLRNLYASLIQPVAAKGYLRGKKRILVAPHAELHFVSFASLMPPGSSDRFLVDDFELAYVPSATVWFELGRRPSRKLDDRVLALAPNSVRLPGSKQEVAAIGRIYGRNATVKLGVGATESALRAALAGSTVLHLATFGVLNKHNPLFSFVELAPGRKDDGRLEVGEVFGLPLSGQLIVLSACQTALGSGSFADVPPGDDWVGLVQAFLQAGARSVVATLWPVEDRATSVLMEKFHRRLAGGGSPAKALAEAQREVIRSAATVAPVYWAGFTVSGRAE